MAYFKIPSRHMSEANDASNENPETYFLAATMI
jgi:hypothetical protein